MSQLLVVFNKTKLYIYTKHYLVKCEKKVKVSDSWWQVAGCIMQMCVLSFIILKALVIEKQS